MARFAKGIVERILVTGTTAILVTVLGDMARNDLVSKSLLANFFRIVGNEKIEKKLCQKITYKYCKNRKNNKSNKNQDLEREEAKVRAPKCPQISQKLQK